MKLLRILLTAALVSLSLQYCVLQGTYCPEGKEDCLPAALDWKDPEVTKPNITDLPPELLGVCPDFDGKPSCCNKYTTQTLKTNLLKVDLVFGNNQTGCSICSANIRRFWCMFNCAPHQSDFIIPGSSFAMNYTINPDDPDSKRLVMTSNITLDIKTTCGIFQSCENVDFTKALGSMSTYQGLFNLFSAQAVTQGNVLMNFTYSANETAMKSNVTNCSMIFNNGTDQYNYSLYQQGWCNCQHCASNCTARSDWDLYIKQNVLLDGLKWKSVITAVLVGLALTLIGMTVRYIADKSGQRYEEGEEDDLN